MSDFWPLLVRIVFLPLLHVLPRQHKSRVVSVLSALSGLTSSRPSSISTRSPQIPPNRRTLLQTGGIFPEGTLRILFSGLSQVSWTQNALINDSAGIIPPASLLHGGTGSTKDGAPNWQPYNWPRLGLLDSRIDPIYAWEMYSAHRISLGMSNDIVLKKKRNGQASYRSHA